MLIFNIKTCIIITLINKKLLNKGYADMINNSDDIYIKNSVKESIKKFREDNGFKQEQISSIMGVDRSTYSKWESGATMPNIVQLAKLAAIYAVEVGKFFEFDFNLNVASPDYEDVYGDDYLSELNDEERYFLASYRLLNRNDKDKVLDYIKNIKE